MIAFTGPVYDSSGYAVASRTVVKLLYSMGVNLGLIPNRSWSIFGAKLDQTDLDRINSLVLPEPNTGKPPAETEKLFLYNMQRNVQGQVNIKFKKMDQIVHTMFETDRCPEAWVPNLNVARWVLLPSRWGVETFLLSGVRNVEYMPFYVDTDVFSPATPKLLDSPEFKFLFMGDLSARKNLRDLLKVFLFTFQGAKDVALVVKTWVGTKDKVKSFAEEIRKLRASLGGNTQYPKIYLYNDFLPEPCMPGFFNSCDCYVSPSCGEGFGLPHLYSMACEKPVISINWGACSDYITDENALPIQYEVKPVPYEIVKQDMNFYGHQWAYPSLEHVSLLMKWVYNNREELPFIGKKARQTVIDKYSLPVVWGLMESFLKRGNIE